MRKFITEMTTMSEQLREMGEETTSKKFAIIMLGSLPQSYDHLVTSMNTLDINHLDWENIKGVLMEEYLRCQEKEREKASENALLMKRNEDALYTQ